jgi:hypothetical protein
MAVRRSRIRNFAKSELRMAKGKQRTANSLFATFAPHLQKKSLRLSIYSFSHLVIYSFLCTEHTIAAHSAFMMQAAKSR